MKWIGLTGCVLVALFAACSSSSHIVPKTEKVPVTIATVIAPAFEHVVTTTLTLSEPPLTTPIDITKGGSTGHLPQDNVQQLTLDSDYVYWNTSISPRYIFRYPLSGGEVETVTESIYTDGIDGVLTVMRPLRTLHWLVYGDWLAPSLSSPWLLRMHDLETNQETTLYNSIDSQSSFNGVDSEGEWLVLATLEQSKPAGCTQSVISLYNLFSKEKSEIERLCVENTHISLFPSISNGYVAFEQDLPDSKGGGNNIFLYEIKTKQTTAITSDGVSSTPELDWPWVAWKNSLRFSVADATTLHNLQTGETRIVKYGYDNVFLSNHRWLLVRPRTESGVYLYDILNRDTLWLAQPIENQSFDSVVIHNKTIAWWRDTNFNSSSLQGIIEWRAIPD